MTLSVGLTGGLASGKSTVARLLAERGARVLDADRVVAELYEAGGDGALAVANLFGNSMLDPSGAVDRPRLGALVFDDGDERERLNAAIHPLVAREVGAWLGGLDDTVIAVVESTLMIETGSYRGYDRLVVVWCGADQQLQRAAARGMSLKQASRVIAAQTDLDEKRAFADHVIDNSKDHDHLVDEVDRVWTHLVDEARAW